VLEGVATDALAKLARLSDEHRFGGLGDLARLHHEIPKAKGGGQ
jgi:hypothetical protein